LRRESPRRAWRRKQLELSLERDVANQDTFYDTEDAYAAASLYARLGEKQRALGLLEEARAERALLFEWVKFDPAFDGMRSDPAFMAFLRIAGLG
jgi:hypothetical protein